MTSSTNRNPESPRVQLLPRISLTGILSLVTLGVALTLIVIPGVPVVSSQEVIAVATDDPEPEQPDDSCQGDDTVPDQDLKRIEGWILDLADDSWAVRRVARQQLIEKGDLARALIEPSLESPDLEVRAQAQSIIEQIDQNKKQPGPVVGFDDGDGRVERRVIRMGPDGSIQIEVGPDGQVHIVQDRPSRGTDPIEAIRDAEQQMRKLEQEMLRRIPDPLSGRSIFGPLDPLGPFGGLRGATNGWSGSTRFQVTRDGKTVVDSSTSSSMLILEPAGIAFETLQPSLRAHLPSLTEGGLLISRVGEGSYAESVGLQRWDILVSLGETPITSFEQIEKMLVDLPDNYRWNIIRGGQATSLETSSQTNPKPKRF
ncbi:MAG: hypothetical protein HRU16_05770 [Planctomycetes bacterium]|nr:hypothetical protein [Planctomycetota bacterium]